MKTLTERYKRVTAHHLDQLHDALATLHEKAEGAKTDADARDVLKRIERYQRDLSGLVLSHAKGIADTARHFPMDENGRAFQADVEAIDRAVTGILNQRPHTSAQARQWAEDFWDHRSTLLFAIVDIQHYLEKTGRPLKHDPESDTHDPETRRERVGPYTVTVVGDVTADQMANFRAAVKRLLPRMKRVFPRGLKLMPRIEVHSTMIGKAGDYATKRIRMNARAFGRSAQSATHTLAHELGHHIYHYILSNRDRAAWKTVWSSILPKIKGQYSATNDSEGFCEAFGSLVTHGPRTLDLEVKHVMKQIVPGLKIENSLFTHEERNRLLEAAPGGAPKAIDIMGQAKAIEFTGATIGRIPNAFVVRATRPDGTHHDVAKYYFQDDKPRAKRHAKWDATITLKSLKRTLGLTESSKALKEGAEVQILHRRGRARRVGTDG